MLIPIPRRVSRTGWPSYAHAHGLEVMTGRHGRPKQGEKMEGGAISGQLGYEKPFIYRRFL